MIGQRYNYCKLQTCAQVFSANSPTERGIRLASPVSSLLSHALCKMFARPLVKGALEAPDGKYVSQAVDGSGQICLVFVQRVIGDWLVFVSINMDMLQAVVNASMSRDLVLTDLWMPGMDGRELLGKIRENHNYDGIRVFAVTADVEFTKKPESIPFDGFVIKPVTLKSLGEILA